MAVNESTFPTQDYGKKNIHHTSMLSLNEIFRESMRKAQAEVDNLQVIVRCENLPKIEGNQKEMMQLFDNLLSMILNHPPKNSKLFLYVDCEEDEENSKNAEKRYIIKFNTNIAAHEDWKVINSQALINCRQILSGHNGSLVVNHINSTGCLFILSLPGKME